MEEEYKKHVINKKNVFNIKLYLKPVLFNHILIVFFLISCLFLRIFCETIIFHKIIKFLL